MTIRAVSFTSAALILAVIVTFLKQPLRLRRSEAIPVATVGIFLICGFNVLTSFGQVLIETSKAAIIAYTMPSLTALLAAIYLGERVGMRLVLALTIAMIGLAILASENLLSLAEQPIGPAIMMLAALSWATGTVGLKSRTWRLPPLPLTVWFFAFSSLAACIVGRASLGTRVAQRTGASHPSLPHPWTCHSMLCLVDSYGGTASSNHRCYFCADGTCCGGTVFSAVSGGRYDLAEKSGINRNHLVDYHYAISAS